jgi:hypothetical protein
MRSPTLQQFFRHQVQHGFQAHGIAEPATVDYVSEVLSRFADTRALYALHDTDGRPLEHVIDFLCAAEAQQRDSARARTLLRHLGEYTLFMSGLFRERLVRRGELDYYQAQGASAYWRCAAAEPHPARRTLFQRLYESFTRVTDTLDVMRRHQLPLAPAAAPGDFQRGLWRT